MIIPLEKLLSFHGNKYLLTRSMMIAVDRIAFIKEYPEENRNWKVVSHVLEHFLNDKVRFDAVEEEPVEEAPKKKTRKSTKKE